MSDRISKALVRLAAEAAPSASTAQHLSEHDLLAIRTQPEDDERLEGPLRHLAVCAACRARLTEPQAALAALVSRAEQAASASLRPAHDPPRPQRVFALRRRPQRWLLACALAASVLVWIGIRRMTRPVVLVQSYYIGVMGHDDLEPTRTLAPEDQNLELTLQGAGDASARLLLVDDAGKLVSPVLGLRASQAGPQALLAPRTFMPERGSVHALAVFGERSAVECALARLAPIIDRRGAPSLTALRSEVDSAAAECGAHSTSTVLQLRAGGP